MLLVFLLLFVCQLSDASIKGRNLPTGLKNRFFGPSYQPKGWNLDDVVGLRAEHWSYDDDSEWPMTFQNCGGSRQSPIDINTEKLIKRKTRKSLRFGNYSNVPDRMFLENSRHSIHLTGVWEKSRGTPFVTGGPLEKRYQYSQLHFHWGKGSSYEGSEHKIDGKSFPVEMHVVHDRFIEDPTNVSEEGDSDNLVVVTYMLELSDKDNPALEPILQASRRVQGNQKKRTEVKPFAIDDIVEPFHGDYVTYQGSLTTPPCTEGVIWIINSKPIEISSNQEPIYCANRELRVIETTTQEFSRYLLLKIRRAY